MHHDFYFDGKYYLQDQGTAMGHKCAPLYTNLYMSECEHAALYWCNKHFFYKPFLDDIIRIWTYDTTSFNDV